MLTSLMVLVLAAYLVGSLPFSYLIARWRAGVNLREVGEGNVGSRNVWHVVGPMWGVVAGALDIAKGLVVYQLAQFLHPTTLGIILAGIAALLGHQFPIYLHGQGGKGLATAAGFLLALSPLSTVTALAILGVAYLVLHDFNPSLIIGIIAILVLPILYHQPLWVAAFSLMLALLLGLKKWLDSPHEARVWESHPWEGGARPGFHDDHTDDAAAPSPDARSQ